MSHQINITRIRAVSNALGELKDQVVFVGGATVSLYSDRRAAETRPTDDIDVVIEIWAHRDYAVIDERLRQMGFVNDQDSGVVCRYIIDGIIVDVMPTQDSALGFSNRWYPQGFTNAEDYDIGEQSIRIFSAPYFIASKLEAFHSRGNNDGRTSTDFEDILFVLENRRTIWDDMEQADIEIREYLKETFTELISRPHFEEWVYAHAGYGSPPPAYIILENLKKFIAGEVGK
jgi:predicted nucleotidyltransferase